MKEVEICLRYEKESLEDVWQRDAMGELNLIMGRKNFVFEKIVRKMWKTQPKVRQVSFVIQEIVRRGEEYDWYYVVKEEECTSWKREKRAW